MTILDLYLEWRTAEKRAAGASHVAAESFGKLVEAVERIEATTKDLADAMAGQVTQKHFWDELEAAATRLRSAVAPYPRGVALLRSESGSAVYLMAGIASCPWSILLDVTNDPSIPNGAMIEVPCEPTGADA